LWESTPGLVSSGVNLRLGGGLPSNLEISVVIDFNWKVVILVKQNLWVMGLNNYSRPLYQCISSGSMISLDIDR
jgi:hypothetical protein